MSNMEQMMKQAQEMQAKMVEMQDRLGHKEIEGTAGGGQIRVTLNGKAEMKRIMIDRTLLDPSNGEILEDLVVAAFNDAKNRVEDHIAEQMAEMTQGMDLPEGLM